MRRDGSIKRRVIDELERDPTRSFAAIARIVGCQSCYVSRLARLLGVVSPFVAHGTRTKDG